MFEDGSRGAEEVNLVFSSGRACAPLNSGGRSGVAFYGRELLQQLGW